MTIAVPGSYTVSVTAAIAAVSSITLSDVGATLAIAAPGVTEAITAGLTNSGTVDVDATGTGGTSVTIEGTLSNSGVLAIGNTSLSKSTTVTAAALANTGTIDLTRSAAVQASLDITGAAPASLTGHYFCRAMRCWISPAPVSVRLAASRRSPAMPSWFSTAPNRGSD